MTLFLGIDIGTASSKAVVTDERGLVVASAGRPHATSSPRPGWFEHDADSVWWEDARALLAELLSAVPADRIAAICLSGIGPCMLAADERGRPLRPAMLYGIDVRAEREIDELAALLGADAVLEHCGNRLTTQSVGPKLAWLGRHEPEVFARTRRWFCASNYVAFRLTGAYVVDHYTASAAEPLYDVRTGGWWREACEAVAPRVELPALAWPGEVVGEASRAAAEETGLRAGTPVLAGTIDAAAEAISVGARGAGDTMVMYGSTMFLIQSVASPVSHPGLWANAGFAEGIHALAAGMATSGLVTTWFSDIAGSDVGRLVEEAGGIPPGSDGLLLLPYFMGERTPLFDPQARGCWLGLTLRHSRAHLYRSILEGVAYGVRHNLEAMAEAGAPPARLVAVGGGTRGDLWTRIVSDVTGRPQDLPEVTVGASYGDARLAAESAGVDTAEWNPVAVRVEPSEEARPVYEDLYAAYRRLYPALRNDMHLLAGLAHQSER